MKIARLSFLGAAMIALPFALPVRAAVEIGRAAPDFALKDLDGEVYKLSDFKGRIVVLEWNNPDCPIVHKHYESGNLPKLQKMAMAKGVIWMLINSGAPGKQGGDYSVDQLKAWLKGWDSAPTAYLRDPDGKVGHLYAAKATPHMFVINAAGVLVYEGAIDSIPSSSQDDIPKAENYVSEALAAVEGGKPVAKPATQAYGCAVKYAD